MGRVWSDEERRVIDVWWKGEPPECCVGRCRLVSDMFMNGCDGCGMDDWGAGPVEVNLPVDGRDFSEKI